MTNYTNQTVRNKDNNFINNKCIYIIFYNSLLFYKDRNKLFSQ